MGDLWLELESVEREMVATAVDDAGRLTELMGRRGGVIESLCRAIAGAGDAEAYDRLLEHYAAGQALGDRLRQERSRVVDAWGESSRERQLLHLLEATRSAGAPVMAPVMEEVG